LILTLALNGSGPADGKSDQYSMNRRLGGATEMVLIFRRRDKSLALAQIRALDHLFCSLVTILTMPSKQRAPLLK
jgi:hypothetical protein